MMHLTTRVPAMLLVILLFGACTKHEMLYPTPWLKIDVAKPVTGSNGVIVLGSREQVFYSKVDGRWVRLGTGHASSYMILTDDQAALVDIHDGKGLQLVRENIAPQRMPQAFGRSGEIFVPPDKQAIDVFDCRVHAQPSGCREVQIDRFDVQGTLLATFTLALPEAFSDCAISRVLGYDTKGIPYVEGECGANSAQARCVVMAQRQDSLFVHAVGVDRPWSECSQMSHGGVSLREPEHFEVLQ